MHSVSRRGVAAWLICLLLSLFYVVLYLGQPWEQPAGPIQRVEAAIWPATAWLEGLSSVLFGWLRDRSGEPMASRWTLYGLLYTLAITLGGLWMWRKYGHNRYQVVRTAVVMTVQITLAFSIPLLLRFLSYPEYYLSYLWPLKIDALDPRNFDAFGPVLVGYGFVAALVAVPVLTILYGKRWYCSWVCGCGGLANTFGEPWRHLSDKSSRAWRVERVTVHATLVVAILCTALWLAAGPAPAGAAGSLADDARRWYGLIVVAVLSGVVGVALYPIAGTRVWCRYFCPMAALLGLIQKLGRFRVRVKKGMCISCGLCSEYCEMGIDVRAYAQEGRSFTRASCVGCGLCSEVCPRGVLQLDNGGAVASGGLSLRSFLARDYAGGD